MTKKEANLKEILESLPAETPEVAHIVLKSQFNRKRKPLL